MRKIKWIVILTLVLAMAGCKSTKTAREGNLEELTTARVIKNHYRSQPVFQTLVERLRVRYRDENTSQSAGVSLRMEKDETLWISASFLGITVGKALLTPDKVSYYEKVNRSYFDGDFRFISDFLGTELSYEQVQRLVLGQPVYDLRSGNYKANTGEDHYLVVPKIQPNDYDLLFYFDPQNFRLQQQQLLQRAENRALIVTYGDYEWAGKGWLPKSIRIRALEGDKITEIEMDVRTIETDVRVSFPFSIPNGYKAIDL
ncbi:DUF4292 domain-containing protein [Croceiramulus getboli]|nr:DUF4292 domain-containing protein [Flavobacteriaceae bacterium YJPT1-3]